MMGRTDQLLDDVCLDGVEQLHGGAVKTVAQLMRLRIKSKTLLQYLIASRGSGSNKVEFLEAGSPDFSSEVKEKLLSSVDESWHQ